MHGWFMDKERIHSQKDERAQYRNSRAKKKENIKERGNSVREEEVYKRGRVEKEKEMEENFYLLKDEKRKQQPVITTEEERKAMERSNIRKD